MELIVGKGFKLEIWELALNTMKEGEVSKFIVPQEVNSAIFKLLSSIHISTKN